MRGPLGVSRSAHTEVVAAEPPTPVAHLRGRAQMGRTTRGTVHWKIAPSASGSDISLTATAERLSAFDTVLLALGGGRWFRRVLANGIARLDSVLDERD